MKKLILSFEEYVYDVLGLTLALSSWQEAKRVPAYLQSQYEFYEVKILQVSCLVMFDTFSEEETPGTVKKHIDQLRKKYSGNFIYVRDRITSYNRKRLIDHKIPFIVPGNQLYLPPLGIDLREHFKAMHKEVEKLSPAAQACILYILQDRHSPRSMGTTRWPALVAEKLGYSKMTISRVFKELDALDLATYYDNRVKGLTENGNMLNIGSGKVLWKAALEYFRTPVKRRVYALVTKEVGIKAGLTALAEHSMLAEPSNKVVAMNSSQWKEFVSNGSLKEINFLEQNAIEVELWSYDPKLFTDDGTVDRLSLYLSLCGTEDERIGMALDEMMEKYPW
jgi:hypothetical protein